MVVGGWVVGRLTFMQYSFSSMSGFFKEGEV